MARKVTEIYAAIVAYKDNQTFLQDLAPQQDTTQQLASDLDSTSKVAIWRLWAYTISVAIYLHELLFDLFKKEIDNKIANGIWGTIRWYQTQVFKFQFGDNLIYNPATGHYEYVIIDLSKQVIKRCAIIETINGALLFKVAKESNNILSPLPQVEQDALLSYLNKIKFAGTAIQIISGNGDILRVELEIIYDPIIPVTIVHENVKLAINKYIKNLEYNAQFRVIHLIDEIQKIDGLVDVIVNQNAILTRPSVAFPWATILSVHVPLYGFYQIDATASNTLDDTLSYTPI